MRIIFYNESNDQYPSSRTVYSQTCNDALSTLFENQSVIHTAMIKYSLRLVLRDNEFFPFFSL